MLQQLCEMQVKMDLDILIPFSNWKIRNCCRVLDTSIFYQNNTIIQSFLLGLYTFQPRLYQFEYKVFWPWALLQFFLPKYNL